ncbi:Chaperone protein dnaJ 13 [Hondaea fermentalgiana]|uniref:Chaperone protein dnaJ 13 n=1 Tax=Hondaea fermentalgiana TaxID=2315210 RepID=A0A2R5G7K9_9STRA|nr:Chaperone protein dnaJ 13 [Hondaea fermentalgiana]|eukprot:GBG27036.1 Chaperone protein dnaJ 13 [Hondaea fermentalgiana]
MGGGSRGRGGRGGHDDDSAEWDYYALLNVPRHAAKDEIKAAYTRLARLLHPDKRQRQRLQQNGEAGGQRSELEAELEAKEAQDLFIIVDRAYKVLSDDAERAVYDTYGHEGLTALHSVKTDGKAEARKRGGLFHRTPEAAHVNSSTTALGFVDERGVALRERVLGRVQLERELDAIARYNVRGAVQMNMDGRGLLGHAFEPLSEYDMYTGSRTLRFSLPSMRSVVVQQSVEAAISPKDNLTLSAQAIARNNAGGFSASVTHVREINESTSSEVSMTTSSRDPFAFSLKGGRVLDQYSKGSLEFVMREGGRTGLNVQGARKLSDTVTGILQLGFGIESGILVQLQRASRFGTPRFRSKREQEDEYFENFYGHNAHDEDGDAENGDNSFPQAAAAPRRTGMGAQEEEEDEKTGEALARTMFSNGSAMLFMSDGGFGLQANWARSFSQKSSGRVGIKLGASNIELDLTSSRALSAHSKGSVALTVGIGGITLTLRYDRGGLRYSVPLALTSGLSFGAAVVGGFIPAFTNFVLGQFLVPFHKRRQGRLQYEMAHALFEARTKALLQMRIMASVAESKRAKAEASSGLVILCARYGRALHEECDWRPVMEPEMGDFVQRETTRPRLPSDWDMDAAEEAEAAQAAAAEEVVRPPHDPSLGPAPYEEHPPNIDVTLQLNYFSKENALELHSGTSKANLLGFYNPCLATPSAPARLFVRYKIGSWVYEVTCDDLEPLEIPSVRAVLIGNTFSNPHADFARR